MHKFPPYFPSRFNIFSLIVIFICIISLYTALVFSALYGTFELDDFIYFQEMKDLQGVNDYFNYAYNRFDSHQRFISLFSFILNSGHWPDPFYYKLINLVIHEINAILTFLLSYQLLKTYNPQKRLIISLIVFVLWLYAPIHTFATFYSIQRMTLLSTFFILIGVNWHIYLRQSKLFEKNSQIGLILLSINFIITLSLGVFSKENAILLCIFILVIEYIILSKNEFPFKKLWIFTFLWLPILLVTLYLFSKGKLTYDSIPSYPFTPIERLMNQVVILWDYIRLIIFPEFGGYGLIHDDRAIIRNGMNSKVILSSIGLIGLILTSFLLRKRIPIISFAILWFLGGHLLESTVIRLELFFDHRNYLPSFGLHLLIAYGIYQTYSYTKSISIKSIISLSLLFYLFFYFFILYDTSKAWSSGSELTSYQIKFHPDSRRAQRSYINNLFYYGHYKESEKLLNEMIKQYPQDISLHLQQLLMSDLHPEITAPKAEAYLNIARDGDINMAISATLVSIKNCLKDKKCPNLSEQHFREIINALLANDQTGNKLLEFLTIFKAESFSRQKQWNNAIKTLKNFPKDKISRIDIYFVLLQSQYMAKDYDGARQTILKIEQWFEKDILVSSQYRIYLDAFKQNIPE